MYSGSSAASVDPLVSPASCSSCMANIESVKIPAERNIRIVKLTSSIICHFVCHRLQHFAVLDIARSSVLDRVFNGVLFGRNTEEKEEQSFGVIDFLYVLMRRCRNCQSVEDHDTIAKLTSSINLSTCPPSCARPFCREHCFFRRSMLDGIIFSFDTDESEEEELAGRNFVHVLTTMEGPRGVGSCSRIARASRTRTAFQAGGILTDIAMMRARANCVTGRACENCELRCYVWWKGEEGATASVRRI